MKSLHRFDITLKLRGPILTKSTTAASFGLDAAVTRDFKKGRPMLPGTLVEGKVREALWQINERNRLDELFGKETKPATSNEPSRGTLIIGDLLAEQAGSKEKTISRIALDSTLGSAKGEMLRVIETPFLPGQEVEFAGTAEMFCHDENEAKEIARLLRLGLSWLMQLGAQRTTGFGRLLGVDVATSVDDIPPITIPANATSVELEITPLVPLCITRHKIGDNLFESDDIIPGNMLAGAVMQTAKQLGVENDLKPGFNDIRFRHAFPATGTTRPRALPLSSVKVGKVLHDVADHRDPVRLKAVDGFVAPQFPVDWKERDDALERLGWASPGRELRVRTAIDSTKRTAYHDTNESEGGKLFAWELLHPFLADKTTPVVWRTHVDVSKIEAEAKEKVLAALAKALAHLSFVSKTKARCSVKIVSTRSPAEDLTLEPGRPLALVLQTPALLADPRFQNGLSGAHSAGVMLDLYRNVWSELSGHSLTLTHHFAQQHLAGGNHLAIYFQKKSGRPHYDPWLLTDAGSVFVFEVKESTEAGKKLEAWMTDGLPLPQWAIHHFGDNWDRNPFIPQNGFGEVAVHQQHFAPHEFKTVKLADPILPHQP